MTKKELAKLQRHVNRCTDVLGIDRVKVSKRPTEKEYKSERGRPPLAAVGKAHRKEVVMWVTDRFPRLPTQAKDELIAHELLHASESPKWALVDRWHDAGQITDKQYAEYNLREERQVLDLERAFARLLPKWED